VPPELEIPSDPIVLRLDFHHQTTVMTLFGEDSIVSSKPVDAMEVVHALARELTFGTGLLPEGTLWWSNTRSGPVYAFYEPPKIRVLSMQTNISKPPIRYRMPLPGFVFLCQPARPPWVFAVTKRPTKPTDRVYKAPLFNVYDGGNSCPGSHKYPERVQDIIESFFVSFFSHGETDGRSKKYPKNLIGLWRELDGKKKYPIEDLVECGTIADLTGKLN
jgi:PRTRC genetic system protein B